MSWRALLIVGPLLVLLAVLVLLSVGDRPLLGTNRVPPAAFIAVVPHGGQLCTGSPQAVPAGTGNVVVRTSTSQAGPLDVTLVRGGRTIDRGRRTAAYESGDTWIPLAAPVRGAQRAVVCVRNGGIKPLGLSGSPADGAPKVLVDGRPLDALIRIEYRSAHRVSWWSRIGAVAKRFASGKASWVRSWTMWLALGLSLLAIVLGVVALWRQRGRAALLCAVVAVLNALTWSLLVPPFQVPDEESHTAYVQYLAETGNVPKPSFPGYSDEENRLLEALGFSGTIGIRDNRPPHGPGVEARVAAIERSHPGRVGSGDVAGTVVYPPVFAGMEAVPYLLSPTGADLLNRLVWMRVLCALLAGLTVWLTYRFLRELLPSTPWAGTTGALALAFLPMFGFISGGVQNDDGLYVCAAALFWAMAGVLRHGLTVRRGLAVGGSLALGILLKYTMIGLAPAAVATVVVALWREGAARRPLPWGGALSAAGLASIPLLAYEAVSHWVWGRPLTGPLRASHAAVPNPEPATISGQLSYAWELFLPRLPFMDDKFPGITPLWDTWYRGEVGRFGWLDYGFPEWVAIALLPVVVLIVALLVRELVIVHPRLGDLLVYGIAALGVMALLAIVGYHYELKFETYFQSPRYLFALLPLGAAAVAVAARGASRRWGRTVGAAFVVIVMALSVFGQLATLERYYGS